MQKGTGYVVKETHENKPIRVLIVEDDLTQGTLIRDALEMEEDIVCCEHVRDGFEGLKAIREHEPDVMLLDLLMPNMDGVDMLWALHKEPPPKIPRILVLSACNNAAFSTEALALGAEHVLVKPYSLDLIIDNIRRPRKSPLQTFTTEQLILRMLLSMKAPINSHGMTYLNLALQLRSEHAGACCMRKDIYYPIAVENQTSAECVEKSIRSAISSIFKEDTPMLHLLLEFGKMEGKERLTNVQFVTLAAQALTQEDVRKKVAILCQTA